MTEKTKSECIESIAASLINTSAWRSRLEDKYPDPRNAKAAEKLAELAEDSLSLTDSQWELLRFAFNSKPTLWRDALSKAGRHVVYLHKKCSFRFYISNVIALLSQNEPQREWKNEVAA